MLSSQAIRAIENIVTPFNENKLNGASYDLTLDKYIRKPLAIWRLKWLRNFYWKAIGRPDIYDETNRILFWSRPIQAYNHVLYPGEFILCSSIEVIEIPVDMAGILFSRSSTGRVGLEHLHAGFFDPGFKGTATFELINTAPWPVYVKAYSSVVQLALSYLGSESDKPYVETGRYMNQYGPEPGRNK